MINLVQSHNLGELKAARRNVKLLNFTLFTVAACVVSFLILVGAYTLLIVQSQDAAKALAKANQQKASIAAATKEVNDFKTDLAAAKAILSRDVTLSNLAIILTEAIPKGVVVDTLPVDPTTLSQAQNITIFARSASDAITIKQQFNESPYITDAFIQNVTDMSAGGEGAGFDPQRPYQISITYKYDVAAIIAETKKRTEEGR